MPIKLPVAFCSGAAPEQNAIVIDENDGGGAFVIGVQELVVDAGAPARTSLGFP